MGLPSHLTPAAQENQESLELQGVWFPRAMRLPECSFQGTVQPLSFTHPVNTPKFCKGANLLWET